MERRLTTILAADAVGYSTSMAADEQWTLDSLAAVRAVIERQVEAFSGRIFSVAGDGFLAEFASPVSGVRAGYDIQRDIADLRRADPRHLQLRIGVHLCDVVVKDRDLLGDGVNVAARISGVAEPGSVAISLGVFEQVRRGAKLSYEPMGEQSLKGLRDPVRLFRIVGEQPGVLYQTGEPERQPLAANPVKRSRRPSIIVLPLRNMSGDAAQDYLADGLTEDLILDLARFSELFVLSRTASFAYRARALDPQQIGTAVGADFCLDGSVRKQPERLRVSLQLLDTASGEHVWVDRFDAPPEAVFDLQDEIVGKVVATIVGRVENRRSVLARAKRPADLDAYDCLLRGLDYHRRGGATRDDAEQAVHWFAEAIKRDHDYARANAWCACAIGNSAKWQGIPWEAHEADPRRLLERAYELDQNDPEIHRMFGEWHIEQRNYRKAEQHFKRALDLNPSHSFVVARFARLYNVMGRPSDAIEMIERAKQLDPLLPDFCRENETTSLYLLGRYAEVLEQISGFQFLTMRAAVYGTAAAPHLDDPARIATVRGGLIRLDPDFSIGRFVDSEAFADDSITERLRADLAAAELPT